VGELSTRPQVNSSHLNSLELVRVWFGLAVSISSCQCVVIVLATLNSLSADCRYKSDSCATRNKEYWKMASVPGRGDCLLCADWLVRCQILTRDQRAAQETATVNDLHHALRDGVLICLLINRLRPKTIDLKDFSQRPQMSQVCSNGCVWLWLWDGHLKFQGNCILRPF